MGRKILVVDDDPHILDVVVFALEQAGMTTETAKDGAAALELFQKSVSDLIVLDINMPEMDGLDVCREIRKSSNVPVLFLSSRDEEIDRIVGLELGADDYLTKPFSPRELVARVKAILKRTSYYKPQETEAENGTYTYGKVTVEPDKHQASWNGKVLELTATEFSILCAMVKAPEMVFNRDRLMDHAYDMNINVSDRTIDSHIRNIRKKFTVIGCDDIIRTIRGVGYKLA